MKKVLLLSAGILISTAVLAQFNLSLRETSTSNSPSDSKSGPSFGERIYVSGGGGLGGGTNAQGLKYSYFSILPTLGYKVTDEFLLGLNIYYSKYNFPDIPASYEQFGYGPFARYYIEQLFFQLEYLRIKTPNYSSGYYEANKYYERLLVGIGYKMPLGDRSAINAMALYDLLYQPNSSPFLSPVVFRVFFSF